MKQLNIVPVAALLGWLKADWWTQSSIVLMLGSSGIRLKHYLIVPLHCAIQCYIRGHKIGSGINLFFGYLISLDQKHSFNTLSCY